MGRFTLILAYNLYIFFCRISNPIFILIKIELGTVGKEYFFLNCIKQKPQIKIQI